MEQIKIGLPVSPSSRISIEEFKSTRVMYTYGGGIGGSRKTIYSKKVLTPDLFKNKFIEVECIDDEIININTEFIVDYNNVTMIKDVVDTTAHSNYHNKEVQSSIVTRFIPISVNQSWWSHNNYGGLTSTALTITDKK